MLYESRNFLKRTLRNKRREAVLSLAQGSLIPDVGCGDGYFLEKLDNAVGAELSKIRARKEGKV